ncbi:helix-turn-helix domain-containing protein [Fictibacillus terranigra]|uniref:Helix-turn-helix domain-containing protein n=1 Tax=Fictibacillus terranigra TaxID=3058424 RepID=A0ABT8EC48_9BACL|nr:helix-turn-helix domain-containing protein [Fictibacillus sp. CENA-BCM004]MDN4075447.1 helix-turn-helix domain-containing protein [Fictibacillus sp. CENA-BCM004]
MGNDPEHLTTHDVATILNITPQMVRRYCAEGTLNAWRTLGDRGEWRIDVEQFEKNPNYIQMVKRRTKNLMMANIVEELSTSKEYQEAMDQIEQERDSE